MIGYEEGDMEKRSKRAVVLLCGIGLWIFYLFQQELAEHGLYTIISYNVHELLRSYRSSVWGQRSFGADTFW